MTTNPQADRILLVDDDEGVRTTFTRIVSRAGFTVDAAGSCDEAVALCGQRPYAVVALDYAMPGTTGFDVHARLRDLAPDATFGLISAQCDLAMAVQATNDFGFRFVLPKPWHIAELLSVLSRAMEEWWERSAMRKLQRHAMEQGGRRPGPVPAVKVIDAITAIFGERAPDLLRRARRMREIAALAVERCDLSPSLSADVERAAFIRGALHACADWRRPQVGSLASTAREGMHDALRALAEHCTSGPLLAAVERGGQANDPSATLAARLIVAVEAFDQRIAISVLPPAEAVERALETVQSRSELDRRAIFALRAVDRKALERVIATHRPGSSPTLAATVS